MSLGVREWGAGMVPVRDSGSVELSSQGNQSLGDHGVFHT